MLPVLVLLSGYYSNDLRENTIVNTCVFKLLRINFKDILCVDHGINKKYCNHYSIPYEFLILNETGINYQDNIVFKPIGLWIVNNYYKNKLADFYYHFTCSKEDNEPRLLLNIVPTFNYDKSYWIELFNVLWIMFMIYLITRCIIINNFNYNFISGYMIGFIYNYTSNFIISN